MVDFSSYNKSNKEISVKTLCLCNFAPGLSRLFDQLNINNVRCYNTCHACWKCVSTTVQANGVSQVF